MKNFILFVDTETTGIPLDPSASYKNIDNWPKILQIAWIVYKKDGTLQSSHNFAISIDTTQPSLKSSESITRVILPIHKILDLFLQSLSKCDVIVGHNIVYDIQVILCELYRYGKETSDLETMRQFCTMKNSVAICGFDTSHGDRYPKLQELYSKLFHKPFENAHDAYCDVKATADCFWKIFNDGLLKLDDYPFLIDHKKKAQMAKSYAEQAEQSLERIKTAGERKSSIISEACEALGIDLLFSAQHEDVERILNYIRTKYNIKPKDDASLGKLLEDDKLAQENAKIQGYDESLRLFKKAAELGDSYSMFRIGHLYYYDLDDKKNAIGWYIKAIENGYVSQDCYYEYAKISTRLYGLQSTDGPKYFGKWAQLCEDGFDTISRDHLDRYIEAFETGRYGQNQNLPKAIELCRRALTQNRLDCGRTDNRYGVRYKLATLLEQSGDYRGAVEQYEKYIQELRNGKKYSFDCLKIEERLLGFFFEGKVIDKDYIKTQEFIDILVKKSSSVGFYYLGRCYEDGLANCSKDSYKAFQCYKKAADDVVPFPDAIKRIGIMYLYGNGCERNKKLSRKYLIKAKEKGLNVSQYLKNAKSWFF